MSDIQRYVQRSIRLHWISAAAIATMWLLEEVVDFLPKDQRFLLISSHLLLGFVLVGVIAARLSWRFGGASVKLPKAEQGPLGTAAVAVHHLLYLLVLLVLALGLTVESMRGDTLYHLLPLPKLLDTTRELRRAVTGYHELAANSLIVLACLHGAAALFHHFVKKDGVLRRMLPG